MKKIVCLLVFIASVALCHGQSIIGKWQLIKQSNCVEDEMDEEEGGVKEMVEDMKALSGSEPQILEFKDNNTASESTKIINKKKSYNSRSFLYRFDSEHLYILDKRSRTIIDGFVVEKFDGDSLIISNAKRVCDTKVFVRLK